ncbi:Hypothetical predicted protein [Pelobates cultripes]|uniref:Uncharacterized protein n=1 Tax=Pelobates cultripes TaxID=61616 RepID=A0AAD1SE67_PELCU|nr:Hypothetical predicted protein [Pelobates cultripes]
MGDLMARIQATESKTEEVMETVHTHEAELQNLRDQLRYLEEFNEDLNNKTCRNNIRVRGLPETVSTELLPETLTTIFQNLIPDAIAADLLMDHVHHALRALSTKSSNPQDVIVRMHYYHIKERIMCTTRDTPVDVEGVHIQLYQDLAPNILKRRKDLRPLIQHLHQHGLPICLGTPL